MNNWPFLEYLHFTWMTKGQNKKAEIPRKSICLLFYSKKKAHDYLGGDTGSFSSQIIISTISVIIVNSKGSRSPHPNSLLAPIYEMSLLKTGKKCEYWAFYHSAPFLMKILQFAQFKILIQASLKISHQ